MNHIKKLIVGTCCACGLSANAGSLTQCTSTQGWTSASSSAAGISWSNNTPEAAIVHNELVALMGGTSEFHKVRTIGRCHNMGPDDFDAPPQYLPTTTLTASTQSTKNIYCWCKMIRPFPTPWFASGDYYEAGGGFKPARTYENALLYSFYNLDVCLAVCPYMCANKMIEDSGLPSDVISNLGKLSDLSDAHYTAPTGDCSSYGVVWEKYAIEKPGLGFEENCDDIGGVVIPTDSTAPACMAQDRDRGTCFHYLSTGTEFHETSGTFTVESPCNEF